MVIISFFIDGKDRKSHFFEETFLLVDFSMEVICKILFLTLSNVQIDFNDWELRWKSYNSAEVLFTTCKVELVRKKEFTAAAFDPDGEAFVVHVTSIVNSDPIMYLSHQAKIALLKADEAHIAILSKYTNFADVFFPNLIIKLLKYTEINDHTIELIDSK